MKTTNQQTNVRTYVHGDGRAGEQPDVRERHSDVGRLPGRRRPPARRGEAVYPRGVHERAGDVLEDAAGARDGVEPVARRVLRVAHVPGQRVLGQRPAGEAPVEGLPDRGREVPFIESNNE